MKAPKPSSRAAREATAFILIMAFIGLLAYREWTGGVEDFWMVGLFGVLVMASGVVLLGSGAMTTASKLWSKVRQGGDGE